MGDYSSPYPGAESYVTIDGGTAAAFSIYDLFNFEMQPPLEFASDIRTFTGDLHTVQVAFKDVIKVTFPRLDQAEADALNRLLRMTGANAYHSVKYSAAGIVRIWDGTTPPGYTVNSDVGRVRKKIRFQPLTLLHWPQQASFYSAELNGEET